LRILLLDACPEDPRPVPELVSVDVFEERILPLLVDLDIVSGVFVWDPRGKTVRRLGRKRFEREPGDLYRLSEPAWLSDWELAHAFASVTIYAGSSVMFLLRGADRFVRQGLTCATNPRSFASRAEFLPVGNGEWYDTVQELSSRYREPLFIPGHDLDYYYVAGREQVIAHVDALLADCDSM
jgi:hypothetical protein